MLHAASARVSQAWLQGLWPSGFTGSRMVAALGSGRRMLQGQFPLIGRRVTLPQQGDKQGQVHFLVLGQRRVEGAQRHSGPPKPPD